jgi:hypothetical protein
LENDPRTEPLIRWNELSREKTETAIVSSMFEATLRSGEPIEAYSTWLLLGTAAIASFFITNADALLPFITRSGFRWCGLWLVLSCLFGLLAKLFAVLGKIGADARASVQVTFADHMLKHSEEEEKIKAGASFWAISLETGIRIERVLNEFYSPLPKWIAKRILKGIKRDSTSPQVAYLGSLRNLLKQSLCTAVQTLSFLLFLVSGLAYAALGG